MVIWAIMSPPPSAQNRVNIYQITLQHQIIVLEIEKTDFLPCLSEISPLVSSPVTEAAVAEFESAEPSSEVTVRVTDAAGFRSNKLTLRLKLAKSPI